jgi:hypothetical protein
LIKFGISKFAGEFMFDSKINLTPNPSPKERGKRLTSPLTPLLNKAMGIELILSDETQVIKKKMKITSPLTPLQRRGEIAITLLSLLRRGAGGEVSGLLRLCRMAALFIIIILFSSCIEENPNLVNPPSQTQTIYVRFINFASDGQSRVLSMDGITETTPIPAGSSSSAVHPHSDSVVISIKHNSAIEYKSTTKSRYGRGITYTYFALPSQIGKPVYKPVDSLIAITTSTAINQYSQDAYIKFVNAYPDTNISFSLRLGCPNGISMFKTAYFLNYRGTSTLETTRYGTFAVSLVKYNNTVEETIGTYSVTLDPQMQYAFIVYDKGQNQPELLLLDQRDTTTKALYPLNRISDKNAIIRTINFSSKDISLTKKPGGYITQNLPSGMIGSDTIATACGSFSADTLQTWIGTDLAGERTISLEVLKRYSILVFDSANVSANKIFYVEPPYNVLTKGNAMVRVVHAAYNMQSITASLGARTLAGDTSSRRFNSGDLLAEKLNYGEVSIPALIRPGEAPITIFTSFEPAHLLYCTTTRLEADKSYLLVLYNGQAGGTQVALIEDLTQNTKIVPLEEGVFTEVIHAVPGLDNISITLGNVLANAKLFFTESLATVIPKGNNNISISGGQLQFTQDLGLRSLLIATGEQTNVSILPVITQPMGAAYNELDRRFVNACKDVSLLNVKINSDDSTVTPVASNLKFGDCSNIEIFNQEQRFSLFFINANSNQTILRKDNIPLPLGKNYTIIFTGSEALKIYDGIVQQEY